MLKITLLGKEYEVPEDITLSEAFEYAGIKTFHGKGCKSGFCGACAVLYRISGGRVIKACLACQTKVKDGMCVASVPGFEVENSRYLQGADDTVLSLYPEVNSCIGCGTCTRLCPKGIDVKGIIDCAKKGETDLAAMMCAGCVMCGACAQKCPAMIKPYSVGMFARRVVGSKKKIKDQSIKCRIDELADMSIDELKELYSLKQGEKNVSRKI